MNIDRTTVLSVALTVILVTSMFPASIVGTADAMPHRTNGYTVIQGTNCWEVNPYHPGDPNPEGPPDDQTIKPHVEVVERSHELGTFRNSSWDGTPTIESVMDYRYRDPEGGIHDNAQAWGQRPHSAPWLAEQYWKEPWSFGTYGLYNWSENQESHMFFYSGPEGDSVVMRHDKLYDTTGIGSHGPYNGRHPDATREGFHTPAPGRSAVTFIFRDLPAGEWAYMDDLYPEDMDAIYYASGEFDYGPNSHTRFGTRHNNYTFEGNPDDAEPLETYGGGTDFTAHWVWNDHGTDGGAYRGLENLGPGESMVIEPYFDDRSWYGTNKWWWFDWSGEDGITEWVIRRKNGENIHLDKTESVEIRRGSHCPDAEFDFGTNSGTASVEVGEEFALDGSNSGGSNLQYNWDLDGDGQFEDNTTSAVLSHAYDGSASESVSVTLMVEDPDGLQNTVTKQIQVVPAESPDASVSVSGTNENSLNEYHVPNETLTFDATNTTDNGVLNASSAVWRVDGEVTAEGRMQYSHAFSETGDYQVSFTVSDEAGHSTTETMTVSVDSLDTEDPNANAQITPREVEAGANVTFDGSGSNDNRGIAAYRWDFDSDGTVESREETWVGQYPSQGNYNVTLEVVDANGNTDNATVPVTVMERQSPNITEWSYPSQITAGQEAQFSASADDNGRIAEYRWTINGDVVTGNPATYVFDEEISSNQTISVRLVVVDEAGEAAGTSTETITVQPRDDEPAKASLSVSTNQTKVGNDVTFNASGSTDNRDISAYHWDFDGDGSSDRTTENPVVSHSYGSTGTYNAMVMVDDGSDSSPNGTATVQIEVEQNQQAQQDSSGGSSVNTGPPPVNTDTEQTGPNAGAIDVKNARSDETIEASLPESEVASETGVSFERVAVDLTSDDPHVVFETAASADQPESVTDLTTADETLAYLELGGKYLDGEVENATVEFTVSESALGGLAESSDVVVYQYDDGWEQVNATVVETTEDGYRFAATTDGLGTLAVGTNQPVSVAEAGLASDTVATGNTVTATATVENTGTDARSATVNLKLDGNVVASETVEVAPGETEEVTLSGTAPTTGTYEATVGDASVGTLTVQERQPADVSVADVSLNASTIEVGGQVAITATVENLGDEAGEHTVTLTLFGEELDSETVQVPGGETKEVTFVRQIDAPGTYTVDVNGETAEVEVTDEDDGGLGDQAPDVPGFGVGAALAALLAVALLARLRN